MLASSFPTETYYYGKCNCKAGLVISSTKNGVTERIELNAPQGKFSV